MVFTFESDEARKARERQEDLARLRGLRPIDDDFLRCILRDNIPLSQFILRILLNKPDLEVISLETQKDFKRLVGARSVCLDAYATDSTGKRYDLEIQRSSSGAGAHRARYHSSAMDIENLDAQQDFDQLPDTYTIFITETDTFGLGLPCHEIERVDLSSGKLFQDGSHILYVNGAFRDDSALGKLMHDFSCSDPDQMNYAPLEEASRYFKETPEGVEYMCRAFEEIRDESYNRGMQQGMQQGIERGMQQAAVSSIKTLMETMDWSAQEAMDALKIPAENQSKYAAML